MSLDAIVVRVLFAYAFLLAITRIAGKRSVYQGTPLDFVVAVVLGDMIDDLLWAEVSAARFVAGVGAVVLAHVLVSAGVFFSPAFARLVEGTPLPIVRDGALRWDALRRERLPETSAMSSLRAHGIEDLRELRSATIEYSGQISVQKRPWAREAQREDQARAREAAQ